jgi:hypothetical protein
MGLKQPLSWFNCRICGEKCSIVPIASIFNDIEGKKFGGLWFCEFCKKYYTTYFLNYEQIQELKKKEIRIEVISQQKNIKKGGKN